MLNYILIKCDWQFFFQWMGCWIIAVITEMIRHKMEIVAIAEPWRLLVISIGMFIFITVFSIGRS